MKTFTFEEVRISVGESARENWELIDTSKADDLWFHLGSFPSSHVVIHGCENPSKPLLVYAANLCKAHSKAKTFPAGVVKVIYTSICNVKKASRGVADESVGSVTAKKTKTIVI